MVIRVSPKCEYSTFTLRKVTIVREMTNFFKFFSFLADWQSKQQNHARISLSSDLRSETRNQIALSCYSEGQIHESWENRWLDVWYILWIGGGYSKNNCTIQTIHAFTCWVLDSVRVYTVQPLLTATSLQQSLCWSRPIVHTRPPLYKGHGHLSVAPTAQTNISTTASITSILSYRWKSQKWSWNFIRMARWWLIVALVFWSC